MGVKFIFLDFILRKNYKHGGTEDWLYGKIILTEIMIRLPIINDVLYISAAVFILVMNKIPSLLIDKITFSVDSI